MFLLRLLVWAVCMCGTTMWAIDTVTPLANGNTAAEEGCLPELFMQKWRTGEKDIEILLVGDSITANTKGGADNPDKAHSPPGFTRLFWGYLLWSDICTNKAVCDRIDSKRSGVDVFSKTGEWNYQTGGKFDVPQLSAEGAAGLDGTWMSDSPNAEITFQFDSGAYKKLTIVGGQHPDGADCRINITEGNGKLLASLDKENWVEANNFSFSQEGKSAQSTLYTGIALHQRHRRVWMKVANPASSDVLNVAVKRIPRANPPDDRFMYFWGTERWNKTSVFLTNLGRGGRHIYLLNYNVTDIYDRNPDLVIVQMPVMNERDRPYSETEPRYKTYFFGKPEDPTSYLHTRSLSYNSNGFQKFTCLVFSTTGSPFHWDGDTPLEVVERYPISPHLMIKNLFNYVYTNNTFTNLKFLDLYARMIDEGRASGMTMQEFMAPPKFSYADGHVGPGCSAMHVKYLSALFHPEPGVIFYGYLRNSVGELQVGQVTKRME